MPFLADGSFVGTHPKSDDLFVTGIPIMSNCIWDHLLTLKLRVRRKGYRKLAILGLKVDLEPPG